MLSIVVPIYNEVENIPELHEELQGVLVKLERSYEIIYVDDGSKDGSHALLKRLADEHPEVVVIQFRRNFGQTAALAAGLEASRGDVVIFMDGDLQNDPAEIPRLLRTMDEGDFDVVSGWRKNRQDAEISRKLPSRMANWLISKVSGVQLHDYGCTLKAYRRDVLKNVKLYGEMHRFIPAYAHWAGATVTELAVNHRARKYGKSKYGINRTIKVLLDLLTLKFLSSYSTKPIQLFGGLGAVCFLFGFLSILFLLYARFFEDVRIHRNPVALISVFLFMAGLLFITQGLLAELVTRTYFESQGKSTYVIRSILGRGLGGRQPLGRASNGRVRGTRYLKIGGRVSRPQRETDRPLAGAGSGAGRGS